MQQYDSALKGILQRLGAAMLEQVTGFPVERWHNIELQRMNTIKADLLGESADGRLVHIELQSSNDLNMILRMAEYSLTILRTFGRQPSQIVLYVGQPRLNMANRLEGPNLTFQCRMVDVRELDGEVWLASESAEDNVMAVLMEFADQTGAIRRILRRIASCEPERRSQLMTELLILAGLRKTGDIIKREAGQMPILNDIMDHEVIGPILREGMELGLEKGLHEGLARGQAEGMRKGKAAGLKEGKAAGRNEGERKVVLRMLSKRFGQLPEWAKRRVASMSAAELDATEDRLLDCTSLEETLR